MCHVTGCTFQAPITPRRVYKGQREEPSGAVKLFGPVFCMVLHEESGTIVVKSTCAGLKM